MTNCLILLVPLAAWRLSRMVRKESGPFKMFGHFRDFIGIDCGLCYDDGSRRELFSCNKCLGWWCSLIFMSIYLYSLSPLPEKPAYLLLLPLTFASSAITLFLESLDENYSKSCQEKHDSYEPTDKELEEIIRQEQHRYKQARQDSGLPQPPPER